MSDFVNYITSAIERKLRMTACLFLLLIPIIILGFWKLVEIIIQMF